jgi:hypothetical protein
MSTPAAAVALDRARTRLPVTTVAERIEFADALKRVTQDISINRSIHWKEARLLDTMGYRLRSTRCAAQPGRAARTSAPTRPWLPPRQPSCPASACQRTESYRDRL